MQAFVNKARILVNVRSNELKDKELIYDWLWEKFRNYGAIAHETRKIRHSKPNSRARACLWAAINNHLEHNDEDANRASLKTALNRPAAIFGASATS